MVEEGVVQVEEVVEAEVQRVMIEEDMVVVENVVEKRHLKRASKNQTFPKIASNGLLHVSTRCKLCMPAENMTEYFSFFNPICFTLQTQLS